MPITVPMFYGILMRRNERTAITCKLVEDTRVDRLLEDEPSMSRIQAQATVRAQLAQEPYLIAFSAAMNADDLDFAMEELEQLGMIRGDDFVPTASPLGVHGQHPVWLKPVVPASIPEPMTGQGIVYTYAGAPLNPGGAIRAPAPGIHGPTGPLPPRPHDCEERVNDWLSLTEVKASVEVLALEPFAVDLKPAADLYVMGWACICELTGTAPGGKEEVKRPLIVFLRDGKQVMGVMSAKELPVWANILRG